MNMRPLLLHCLVSVAGTQRGPTPRTTTPQTTAHRPSVPPATARPSVPHRSRFRCRRSCRPVGAEKRPPCRSAAGTQSISCAPTVNTNPFELVPHMVAVRYFDGYPSRSRRTDDAAAGHRPAPIRRDAPIGADLFSGSFYAGTIADIEARRLLTLVAGPHRIDCRRGLSGGDFDAANGPDRRIIYRTALERERTAANGRRRPTGPTHMYMIPAEYTGNMAPRAGSTALRMRHQAGARHRPAEVIPNSNPQFQNATVASIRRGSSRHTFPC